MHGLRRRIGSMTILVGLVGSVAGVARAESIIYNILDHPTYENGYTLSGTITTDGTLGLLKATDILSWSVTLTEGSNTQTYTDMGQNVGAYGGYSSYEALVATSSQLYAPTPGTFGTGGNTGISLGSQLYPGTMNTAAGTEVSWVQSSYVPNSNFLSENPLVGYYWKESGTNLNSFNWIVGVVPIPEPSTLTMLGVGVALVGAFLRRAAK